MKKPLLGKKIAVLVANGFSEKDLTFTQKAMMGAGADMRIVSMDHGLVNSWNTEGWGLNYAADQVLSRALAADYDMLIVPGGHRSVEKLELTAHTRRFISGFVNTGKPVAIYGSAMELLLFSECIDGLVVAGDEKFRERAEAQGAEWSEDAYVLNKNVVTGLSSGENREGFAKLVSQFFIGEFTDGEGTKDLPEAVAA